MSPGTTKFKCQSINQSLYKKPHWNYVHRANCQLILTKKNCFEPSNQRIIILKQSLSRGKFSIHPLIIQF